MQKPKQPSSLELKESDIVFEDADLVIINKPSGWPSQATRDPDRPHALSAVEQYLLKQGGKGYACLHHRLDMGTSGLLLFCKSPALNGAVTDLFRDRKIQKTYLALGIFEKDPEQEWIVENHLMKIHKPRTHMQIVRSGGQRAKTHFRVLQKESPLVLLEASPETGRMHQIRVHALNSGCPLLGDPVYFKKGLSPKNEKRLYLHAWRLHFPHPRTQQWMEIETPIPEEFLQRMNRARGSSTASP